MLEGGVFGKESLVGLLDEGFLFCKVFYEMLKFENGVFLGLAMVVDILLIILLLIQHSFRFLSRFLP